MSSIDTTSSPFTVRDETDASRREAATPPLPFRTSLRPPHLLARLLPTLLHGSTRADSDGYLNFFPVRVCEQIPIRSFSNTNKIIFDEKRRSTFVRDGTSVSHLVWNESYLDRILKRKLLENFTTRPKIFHFALLYF